ncbi:hypothetical protein BDY24DRAFT_392836 [Mrakia frigida]|uniref:uncharacterized protein n=1 Tax=Mrakia frigida TaxID=29902 RepID=UPI003FCBF279
MTSTSSLSSLSSLASLQLQQQPQITRRIFSRLIDVQNHPSATKLPQTRRDSSSQLPASNISISSSSTLLLLHLHLPQSQLVSLRSSLSLIRTRRTDLTISQILFNFPLLESPPLPSRLLPRPSLLRPPPIPSEKPLPRRRTNQETRRHRRRNRRRLLSRTRLRWKILRRRSKLRLAGWEGRSTTLGRAGGEENGVSGS